MGDRICGNCFGKMSAKQDICPRCQWDPALDREKIPHALPVDSILNGRFILGRPLGQGGFGITYVAMDDRTGRRVAIKEFFPETMALRSGSHNVTPFAGQRQENFGYGMQCFLSEAQTLAQFIGTETIVGIHSYFEENGTAYFVMDYVEGISLQSYLRQKGRLSWEEARKLLYPIIDALSIVHSKGIIHRDVAPDNIYISSDGTVKLLDFGAARYSLGDKSRSLDVVLKAGYAPREQYTRRGRQGPYTDVYSLAATFYFALTGRTPSESIDRIDEDDLIPISALGVKLPPGVEEVLEKALSVQPGDRFSSMAEFKAALAAQEEAFALSERLAAQQREAEETAAQKREKAQRKPNPPKWLVPALALLLLCVVLAVALPKPQEVPEQVSALPAEEATVAAQTEQEEDPEEALYQQAIALKNEDNLREAYRIFKELGDFRDSREQTMAIIGQLVQVQTLAAGYDHTLGIREDGSVAAEGLNYFNQCSVYDWKDIISLSTSDQLTAGLRSDGSVVAVGNNDYGQCEVSGWTDIIAVAAGGAHTVGLRVDGTVMALGRNDYGQCEVSGWTDIIAVAAGGTHTVGLRVDGTVMVSGNNDYGQCEVSGWTDIVAVTAGGTHTVGLRADGTVVDTEPSVAVSDWRDIAAVAAGPHFIVVGLREDGTVVAAGWDENGKYGGVSGWTDIAAVSSGAGHIVGLRSNGSIVGVGVKHYSTKWHNIRIPDQ